MHTFKEFFLFEWVRFLGKRNLVVFGLLFVLVLGLTQYGVVQYKETLEEKSCFQDFESKKLDSFISYQSYANYGFRIMTIPSPLYILFFKSAPLGDIIANIDTSERLMIYTPVQSGGAFNTKKNYFTDFSGMMFFLGSFLVLLFGFEGFLNIEYMKTLVSITGQRRGFLNMVLARTLLISLVFLVILVSCILLIAANEIVIPLEWVLPVFLLLIIVNGIFFFAIGTFLGTRRSKVAALLIGLIGWVLLIIVVPMVLDTILNYNSRSIQSIYKVEYEKWKIVNDFDKRYRKEEGVPKPDEAPTKKGLDKILSFWENEYKVSLEKDEKMIRQMEKNTSIFQWLSSIFPTSNYLSASCELSSNGYDGLIEFYRNALKIKIELFLKYIDIVFVKGKSKEKFEPVLTDGENLFLLKTHIPLPTLLGILLTLIYTVSLLTFSHKGYKNELFRLPKKEDSHLDGLAYKLGKGGIFPFFIEKDIFGRQLFDVFSGQREEIGKSGYDFKITFEPEDLVPKDKKSDFLYLSHINKIPGHFKVGAFVKLLMGLARTGKERREEIASKYDIKPLWRKAFRDLNAVEKGRVFMAMLYVRTFEIYLIDDALDNMPYKFAKELKDGLTELAEKEKSSAIFTINYGYVEKGKSQPCPSYTLFTHWLQQLDVQAEVEAKNDRDRS